jgi:hypothetical protein
MPLKCPKAKKAYMKEYYKKNRDKYISKRREYVEKNREEINKRRRELRQLNLEEYRKKDRERNKDPKRRAYNKACNKEWLNKNKEYKRKKDLEYYYKNREKYAKQRKKWRDNNKEKIYAYRQNNLKKDAARSARRRAKKLKATLPGYENDLLEIYNNCPDGCHVDHIVPLINKKVCGLHVPWNLQYLTAEENLKKSNRLDWEA